VRRPVLDAPSVSLEDARAFASEAAAHPLFDPGREVVIARAPGRLDLMGGIADYSGSLVLEWPLREATLAAVQLVPDGRLRAVSLASGPGEPDRSCEAPLTELFQGSVPLGDEAARRWFSETSARRWAAYVFGAAIVLARETGTALHGLRVLIRSSVPEGKGVSSSAALEVAVMGALAVALRLTLDPRELAFLCLRVENRIVGAACGIMDQMTACYGREHALLALLCQPAKVRGTIPLPAPLGVWGFDSGIRHSVAGSAYTRVRVGAFMGARIVADLAGLPVVPSSSGGPVRIADARWGGYLANVTPAELEGELVASLPETLRGAEFLARYGGTADTETRVDPDLAYPVRAATVHPIRENARVREFAEILSGAIDTGAGERLGDLMRESHESYSACGLGSEATDLVVSVVREAGSERGFFGAKITGGGSGGTVAVLGREDADVGAVAEACARHSGRRPRVFSGSSPGAAAFGAMRLGPTSRSEAP
jgi:galactokinase